jgi:hypothetical protein
MYEAAADSSKHLISFSNCLLSGFLLYPLKVAAVLHGDAMDTSDSNNNTRYSDTSSARSSQSSHGYTGANTIIIDNNLFDQRLRTSFEFVAACIPIRNVTSSYPQLI